MSRPAMVSDSVGVPYKRAIWIGRCDTLIMVGRAGMTPRQNVEAECARRGKPALISGCIDLLEGREVDDGVILVLGGAPAEYVLTAAREGRTATGPGSGRPEACCTPGMSEPQPRS